MSQTQSSYDFDHFTEESITPQETFLDEAESHYEEEPTEQEQEHSEYNQSQHSMIKPPISFLQSTFEQLDKDGKGVITKSILKRATMITSDQYDKKIIRQEIQKCGSRIDYSRFVQIFQTANVGDGGVNEWLYSLYDKEEKGFIDYFDLKRVSAITGIELGEEEIEQMLMTERNRGSGKVDYTDFKYLMEEQIQYM